MVINYLICLFAPLPLGLVELILPFPYLVEEVFKWVMVRRTEKLKTVVIMGVIFALSESMFYVSNFWLLGNFSMMVPRLLLTTTMHTLTFGLMMVGKKNIFGSWGTLVLSVFIHFGYNAILHY